MIHRNYGVVDILQADPIENGYHPRRSRSISHSSMHVYPRLTYQHSISPGLLFPGVNGQRMLSSLSQYVLGGAYELAKQGVRFGGT